MEIIRDLKASGMKVKRIEELFSISHSVIYYKKAGSKDNELEGKIREIAYRYPAYGYRRIWATMRREGIEVNIKKVYRL